MFVTRRNSRNIVKLFFNPTQYVKIRTLSSTPTASPTADEDSLKYCANLVKSHDYENFLATLLMTKAIRSPALVVRAFNVEIARIQDQTSDVQTARLRMQFWQDTLNEIFKKDQSLQQIPANPVAQELFKVCSIYKIHKRNLEKLTNSREKLLKTKYFVTLADLEKYSDDSVSAIYFIILNLAEVQNVHADHAASHLGKAQGLANMLRSIPMASHHKMVHMPMDLLMKHKVSQEDVLRCRDSEEMRNCSYEVAVAANNHLKLARKLEVPRVANQIFLPAIAIDSYLKKLQKCNFDVFDKSLVQRSITLPLNFYFKRLMNKY